MDRGGDARNSPPGRGWGWVVNNMLGTNFTLLDSERASFALKGQRNRAWGNTPTARCALKGRRHVFRRPFRARALRRFLGMNPQAVSLCPFRATSDAVEI